MEIPDVGSLAPPASGSLLEVHFRRLLGKCVDRANGEIGGDSMVDWRKDPKFHVNVETLQEQLASLSSSTTIRVDEETLGRYEEAVAMLSDALVDPNIPLYCMRIPQANPVQGMPPTVGAPNPVSSMLYGTGVHETAEDEQLPKSRLEGGLDHQLDAHAQLAEGLTDELVGLASQLKERSKAVEAAVYTRNKLIDDVDDAVTTSAASAAQASKGAKSQHARSKMGTCMMCLVLLAVGCVFTGMMVFIKFTSILGYKAPPAVHRPMDTPPTSQPPDVQNETVAHNEL